MSSLQPDGRGHVTFAFVTIGLSLTRVSPLQPDGRWHDTFAFVTIGQSLTLCVSATARRSLVGYLESAFSGLKVPLHADELKSFIIH